MVFPNFRNKHAEDSMISPRESLNYQKKRGKFPKFKSPKGIIFCYDEQLMKDIKDHHSVTDVSGPEGNPYFHGKTYLIDETNGEVAIIGNFGMGSPVVVTILEKLIAFGVKKFISIGTAGTLQKNIAIGSVMVCNRAIRDEGTSHHYLKHSKYAHASKEMTKKIIQSLEKFKQDYFVGTSWTIDAPYRETVAEAKQYQKEGVASVEMEASALFAVAQYRKVELGAIFIISDSLAELEWKPNFHSDKVDTGLEMLYKTAVNVFRD